MAIDTGNVLETARNLGINENQRYNWKLKYEADPVNAFTEKEHTKPL
jgi:transposase-like protein